MEGIGGAGFSRPPALAAPDYQHRSAPAQKPPHQNKTRCVGLESVNLPAEECEAWIRFYDATGGPKWKECSNHRFDPCMCGSHPATASVVFCDGWTTGVVGHIKYIFLVKNGLEGQIPPDFGSSLTGLNYLALAGELLSL